MPKKAVLILFFIACGLFFAPRKAAEVAKLNDSSRILARSGPAVGQAAVFAVSQEVKRLKETKGSRKCEA